MSAGAIGYCPSMRRFSGTPIRAARNVFGRTPPLRRRGSMVSGTTIVRSTPPTTTVISTAVETSFWRAVSFGTTWQRVTGALPGRFFVPQDESRG